MARLTAVATLLLALALVAGCGGNGTDHAASTSTVSCDDAGFRAQDEELYVTKNAVSNASAAGASPTVLLDDLRRARAALGSYLDAHPPCDAALAKIAASEREALASIDSAVEALDGGRDAKPDLTAALVRLQAAQSALSGAS